jgi:tetratricopeptide (TPR) repeat protein
MTDISQLAPVLQQAADAIRRGDYMVAGQLLRSVTGPAAGHPDRLQLLGLVYRAQDQLEAAEAAFRASLRAAQHQPAVLNNLGNLLLSQGRREEALDCYRQAIKIAPQAADAHRNLGLMLVDDGLIIEAEQALRKALDLQPGDAGAWTALGHCCQQDDRLEAAAEAYQQALKVRPGYANALAGLGYTLRLMDRLADATVCYDAALRSAPQSHEIAVARAALDVNLGRMEEAEHRYRQVLAAEPLNISAHRELNEMLWQMGRIGEFGDSFRQALQSQPDNGTLLLACCEVLAGAGKHEDILEMLQRFAGASGAGPGKVDAQLIAIRARAEAAIGRHDQAMRLFDRARVLLPDNGQLALDHAQLAIVKGDYELALQALEQIEGREPDNQLMWACRATCWRLMGDERAEWLNDTSRFVRTAAIPCPAGFPSLEAFLAELTLLLTRLHTTRVAPSNQTLRGGTQTFGRLFHRRDTLIGLLVEALSTTISHYLEQLPHDPDHPLLRRNTGQFRFSGSWSVRLTDGGYHVNHVHPQGWLSSVFYVSVPEDLGPSVASPAGWLKIGETSLGLGEREVIDRLVQPVAGELTLFPSYTWHGTVPFHSTTPRLTSPFDVVPV